MTWYHPQDSVLRAASSPGRTFPVGHAASRRERVTFAEEYGRGDFGRKSGWDGRDPLKACQNRELARLRQIRHSRQQGKSLAAELQFGFQACIRRKNPRTSLTRPALVSVHFQTARGARLCPRPPSLYNPHAPRNTQRSWICLRTSVQLPTVSRGLRGASTGR